MSAVPAPGLAKAEASKTLEKWDTLAITAGVDRVVANLLFLFFFPSFRDDHWRFNGLGGGLTSDVS